MILSAFLRRDLLVEASYRFRAVFDALAALLALATAHFLAATFGTGSDALAAYGGDYFGFAVLGMAALGPMDTALSEMSRRVRDAQVDGTLDPILVTPIGPLRAVLYPCAWPILWSCVRAVGFVATAALFGMPLHAGGIPAALAAFGLGMAIYLSLGLLSASFTVVFKRGDPVAWGVEQASILLGGVVFPIAVLPGPLRILSGWLPMTPLLDVSRRALLLGAPLSETAPSLLPLGLAAVVLVPVGVFVFRRALDRARDEGSLTHL